VVVNAFGQLLLGSKGLFDGTALLVSSYMKDRPRQVDPAITAGLEEHGLLKIIEPE
jgi:hypothetical protein